MGSTELGVGILLVCLSVAVAALWGSDGDQTAASRPGAVQQDAPASVSSAGAQ